MKKLIYLIAALTACGAEEKDRIEPDGSSWIPDVIGQDFLCSTRAKCDYGFGENLGLVLNKFVGDGRVVVSDFASIGEKDAGRVLSESLGYSGKFFYESEVSDLWDKRTVLVGNYQNSGFMEEVMNYQEKCESDETVMYSLNFGDRSTVVLVGDGVGLMARFYRDFPDLEVLDRRKILTSKELICDAIGAEFFEDFQDE